MSSTCISSGCASDSGYFYGLEGLKESLRNIPECKELEKKIGGARFAIADCAFGAYAQFSNKTIYLSPAFFKDDKHSLDAVQSAIFEMANLSQQNAFESLLGRINKMTPDTFVIEYEKIEHKSALIAKSILRNRVSEREWTECGLVFTPEKFALHYLFQQAAGHSQEIWKRHQDKFASDATYKGTWEAPIVADEKEYVYALIDLKARALDPVDTIRKSAEKDYGLLKEAILERESLQHLVGRVREIERA